MINILKFLFNIYFELKYRLLYYFTTHENNIINIQNGYLIHKNTKEFIEIDIFNFIKKIGHKIIIYTDQIKDYQILDIGFKWNKKDYRIQFYPDPSTDRIIFPFFTLNDIKMKVNNKIVMIEDESGNIEKNMERNKIFNQYSGPLGDFYISKNLGICISNLYSLKYNDFLFRDTKLKMEDIFFNEYEIHTVNNNEIFKFKSNLDETKINKYNTNEDYILKTYDKFNLDWKKTIIEIFTWIFCKKKNE